MRVSLVITVLNESSSITSLLRSLKKQAKRADEIIIVDGGSIDQTVSLIDEYANKHKKLNIRVIQEHGNISHGRNTGVKNAAGPVIVMIDGGCTAKKDWLKKITEPFTDNKHIVVAGFYTMKTVTAWQKAVSAFYGTSLRKLDLRCFLPSARSIAFHKSVWEKVGGFDERLNRAGEDTLFNYQVLRYDIPIIRRPDALVVWNVTDDLLSSAKKFFSYAKGDAQTGIWWHPSKRFATHNVKILTIYMRYAVFAFLFLVSPVAPFSFFLLNWLFVTYLFWSMWKLKDEVTGLPALLMLPVVQLVSDISIMAGFLSGLLQKSQKAV